MVLVSTLPEEADITTANVWISFSALIGDTEALPGKLRKGLLHFKRSACKPGSVRWRNHRDGHFSRSTIARTLQQPTRGVLIEVGDSRRLLGLAPAGVYRAVHVAMYAVGSYPTFSPLPAESGWRSVFCGTVRHAQRACPGVTWRPAHGARTFLDGVKPSRPSGR